MKEVEQSLRCLKKWLDKQEEKDMSQAWVCIFRAFKKKSSPLIKKVMTIIVTWAWLNQEVRFEDFPFINKKCLLKGCKFKVGRSGLEDFCSDECFQVWQDQFEAKMAERIYKSEFGIKERE